MTPTAATKRAAPKKDAPTREEAIQKAKDNLTGGKTAEPSPAELRMIPLESLIPSEDNVRSEGRVDPSSPEILEMAITMKSVGVLEPLLVEPHPFEDGSFRIKAGERRYVAAGVAKLEAVPCIVEQVDEVTRQAIFTIENTQRQGLTAIEQARGLKQLADAGVSQRDIGKTVGMSQPQVSKLLGLLRLPEKAQGWIEDGKLTQEAGLTIASLPAAKQAELCKDKPPVDWEIVNAKRAYDTEQRIEKTKKSVEEAGGTVMLVDYPEVWWQDQLGEDGKPDPDADGVIVLDTNYGTLAHLDPEEHVDQPCAVTVIDTIRGMARPGCTNPGAHPAPDKPVDDEHDGGDVTNGRSTQRVQRKLSPGELAAKEAIESLQPSMRKAIATARADLERTFTYALPALIDSEDPWRSAEIGLDIMGTDEARGGNYERLGQIARDGSPAEAALAFAFGEHSSVLGSIIEWVIDDETPLDAIANQGSHVDNARALVDYLRDAVPDDGIGTLEDIVADFTSPEASTEDPTEPDATGADAASTGPAGDAGLAMPPDAHALADAGLDQPKTEEPSEITVTIAKEGKAGAPKYMRDCSACGRLSGFNTNEGDAKRRGDQHLAEEHGIEVAA